MLYEKVEFDDNDKNAFLEAYIADKVGDFVRKAILIIPGGGYANVCSEREGEPIAMAFIPYGYNAFVLHYTVNQNPFPSHLIQLSKAMAHIRFNAEKYNIDSNEIFVVGFSAGGHLAASLGTMWNKKEIYEKANIPFGCNKPSGMMLIYPVISPQHHKISFDNLLMKSDSCDEELTACSIEKQVSKKTCPAFIFHTSNDEVVDVKNSLVLASALSFQEIKFEMHIYPDAPHGIALGNEITKCGKEKWNNSAISKWIENAAVWADGVKN